MLRRQTSRRQTRRVRMGLVGAVVIATAAGLGLGSMVSAGLIPGSGPGLVRSDCYVELNVQGIDNPGPDVRGGRVVSCTDGDPCDTDGECGNGSCTLSIAVCINQTDPNLAACHPPTGLQKLFVSPRLPAAAVPGSLDGSACGSFVAVPVTQNRMVRFNANATAAKGTSPLTDRDTYVLKCLPRTTPCPTTSTTTTTTSSTTTTTICPNTCLNGGTLNPDCSCTCPSGYESLNGGCFRIATDLSFDCGSGGCNAVARNVDGSGNFLCMLTGGPPCFSSTSQCPLGSACQLGFQECFDQCTSP